MKQNTYETKTEGIYEYLTKGNKLFGQLCPVCKSPIGIIPGSSDAICHVCGYKDPCCE